MTQYIAFDNFAYIDTKSDSEFCCQTSNFDIPITQTTTTSQPSNIFDTNPQTTLQAATKPPVDPSNLEYEFIFNSELRPVSDFKYDGQDGYIDLTESENNVPFVMFQTPDNDKDFSSSLNSIHENTILNGVFFSRKNIDNLQNNIKFKIKEISNQDIGNQSEKELQIVMRSIFLQYAKNNDNDIQKQIADLNDLVMEYCIKNILVNLKQYIGYLEDIQEKVDFIPNPVAADIKGSKNNYNLFKRNDEKIRLYGHTAAFGKALDKDKNFYLKDGRKIYIKTCDSDFVHDSQWKGHVEINSRTLEMRPVVPKTNEFTKLVLPDRKHYLYFRKGAHNLEDQKELRKDQPKFKTTEFNDIFIQEIKEISCDDIDEQWCLQYGDVQFPQYDKNGIEIFRQSANDACSKCCTSRSSEEVDKAGGQDLTNFVLANAIGSLADNTKVDLFMPIFAFNFKNIKNLKKVLEEIQKGQAKGGEAGGKAEGGEAEGEGGDGFMNYQGDFEPIYESFQNDNSQKEILDLMKNASFFITNKNNTLQIIWKFNSEKDARNFNLVKESAFKLIKDKLTDLEEGMTFSKNFCGGVEDGNEFCNKNFKAGSKCGDNKMCCLPGNEEIDGCNSCGPTGSCLSCGKGKSGADCSQEKDTGCSDRINEGVMGTEKLPLKLKLQFVGTNHHYLKFFGEHSDFLNDVENSYKNLKLFDITEPRLIGTIRNYNSNNKNIFLEYDTIEISKEFENKFAPGAKLTNEYQIHLFKDPRYCKKCELGKCLPFNRGGCNHPATFVEKKEGKDIGKCKLLTNQNANDFCHINIPE